MKPRRAKKSPPPPVFVELEYKEDEDETEEGDEDDPTIQFDESNEEDLSPYYCDSRNVFDSEDDESGYPHFAG